MKYIALLFVAFFAVFACSNAKSVLESQAEIVQDELIQTAISEAFDELQQIYPYGILTFGKDFYNKLIAEPVNVLVSSLAGMAAQLTAGIAINGISGLIGKRDTKGALDFLGQLGTQLLETLYGHANTLVQSLALTITQALIDFSNSNGRREAIGTKGALDFLGQLGTQILETLYGHANTLVQSLALTITQALIDFSNGGKGKRGLGDFFGQLGTQILETLYGHANNLVQTLALTITQALVDFSNGGNNGSGRREAINPKGVLDFLGQLGTQVLETLYGHANTLVQSLALAITQALVDFSNGTGKREESISSRFSIMDKIDKLSMVIALEITKILANISENGILPIIG